MKYISKLAAYGTEDTEVNVSSMTVATFFNIRGSSLERSPEGFLRSSIIQILAQSPDSFSHIVSDYLSVIEKGTFPEPVLAKMQKALIRQCAKTKKSFFWIDALDECEGSIRQQIHFLEEIVDIARKCKIGAVRPLTLNELHCALAFGSSTSFRTLGHMSGSDHVVHSDNGLERRIQNLCGRLVDVVKPSLRVQFIHQTVMEFLLASDGHQFKLTLGQSHQFLLRSCVKYLLTPELVSIPVVGSDLSHHYTRPIKIKGFNFLLYALGS